MIEFNGLKSDVIGVCKQIRRMHRLTKGEKLLLEEVLSLPENSIICHRARTAWEILANELGTTEKNARKFVRSMIAKGIFKMDKHGNIELIREAFEKEQQ